MDLESIPVDIMMEILLHLPANSLLRFKCVCKSWYHLISRRDFEKRHLERSLATKSNTHFVFRDSVLKLADYDTFDNVIELDYPFKDPDSLTGKGSGIKGDCNGLLCVWQPEFYNLIITLLNPTTRTYKVLPYLPWSSSHMALFSPVFTYGFGYDGVADDYKFVRITGCIDEETRSVPYGEVMVYSLKADSWERVLDHVPYIFIGVGDGAPVDGVLHWVIKRNHKETLPPIVSFNLSTYNFGEVMMPPIEDCSYMYVYVEMLDGCLCVLVQNLKVSEIWIMREYGVVESWTKLLRLEQRKDDILERTVALSKSGKELFVTFFMLGSTSIDLESKVIKDAEISENSSRRFDTRVCVENLIMLSDSCYDLQNDQHEEVLK